MGRRSWLGAALALAGCHTARAALGMRTCREPQAYQFRRLQLWSDLDQQQLTQRARRWKVVLDWCETWWGEPTRGTIQVYLAEQLEAWPMGVFPDPLARIYIGGIGGATREPTVLARTPDGTRRFQAVVYANAQDGVLDHELVHAYCSQTFGVGGPLWFREGMAELAYRSIDRPVRLNAAEVSLLREAPRDVLRSMQQESPYAESLSRAVARVQQQSRAAGEREVSLAHWTSADRDLVTQARRQYLFAWAFCHLLVHDARFQRDFRQFARRIVRGQAKRLSDQWTTRQLAQLEHAYREFLSTVEPGKRS